MLKLWLAQTVFFFIGQLPIMGSDAASIHIWIKCSTLPSSVEGGDYIKTNRWSLWIMCSYILYVWLSVVSISIDISKYISIICDIIMTSSWRHSYAIFGSFEDKFFNFISQVSRELQNLSYIVGKLVTSLKDCWYLE